MNVTDTDTGDENMWNHPNVKWAVLVALGAGLSTGIGGSLVFFPECMKKVPQATVLAVSLPLCVSSAIQAVPRVLRRGLRLLRGQEDIQSGATLAVQTIVAGAQVARLSWQGKAWESIVHGVRRAGVRRCRV